MNDFDSLSSFSDLAPGMVMPYQHQIWATIPLT